MGASLISFYKGKVKMQWKVAFVTTIIVGLLVHMYKFTNTLPNHDSLFNLYSSQNMVKSGRWFLSIACGLSSYFDLPWVIGVLSLLFIAGTAILITEIFHMENPILVALCSALLVSFPAVTDTYYFEFTADGYMLAMLLAALAVYCSTLDRCGKWRPVLSAILVCLTCGIYQAYVSFALVLALCHFIYELLENRFSTKQYLIWTGKQAAIYSSGLILYLIIWKACMLVQNCVPTSYEGIDVLGQINIHTILEAAYQSLRSFILFFVEWNIFKYGLTLYTGLNILFLSAALLIVGATIRNSSIYKRTIHLLILLICGLAIPFASCIWHFASPNIHYYPRMEQSICICFIFIAVLCERWLKPNKSNIVAVILLAIIFNNGIIANKLYYYMDLCYERSYASAVEMQTRIHLTDNGMARSIVWLGSLAAFPEDFYTDMAGSGSLGILKYIDYNFAFRPIHCMLFLSQYTGFELEYYKTHPEEEIRKVSFEGTEHPVPDEWYISFPLADDETQERLKNSDEVAHMGIWPASDSVRLIGDTIVVKLSEQDEW